MKFISKVNDEIDQDQNLILKYFQKGRPQKHLCSKLRKLVEIVYHVVIQTFKRVLWTTLNIGLRKTPKNLYRKYAKT